MHGVVPKQHIVELAFACLVVADGTAVVAVRVCKVCMLSGCIVSRTNV